MRNSIRLSKSITAVLIALFNWSCGQNSSNSTAYTAAKLTTDTPLEVARSRQNPSLDQRIEKTYNGQTIYLLDIDDFPLQDVPLVAIRKRAQAGEPAA